MISKSKNEKSTFQALRKELITDDQLMKVRKKNLCRYATRR